MKSSIILLTALLLELTAGTIKAQDVLETGSQKPMPEQWIDKTTGHKVIRLVNRGESNHSFYFNNNAFIPQRGNEGDLMVFAGSTAAGSQLFTMNLKTSKIVQLSNRANVTGEMVCAKTREVFYQSKDSVFVVNTDTHKTRLVSVLPADFKGRVGTINADGTYLACVRATGEQEREIYAKYPAKSQYFGKLYDAHIQHTLYTLNVKTGKLKQIMQENEWTNHLLFSPTDPDILSYCHEGPWEKVDRMWNINIKTGKTKMLHKRTMVNEIAGHEFFSPKGNTEWFDLQKPKGATFFLAGINMKTGKEDRVYQMKRDEWSIHFNVTADEKLFTGDGGNSGQVAKAKDGMWIYLFKPAGDHFESERLVNMKNHNYKLEPNVRFSPDNKWIIFRGNFEGQEQIYAVEVAKHTS